jgi:hypothetical protein
MIFTCGAINTKAVWGRSPRLDEEVRQQRLRSTILTRFEISSARRQQHLVLHQKNAP